MIYILKGSFWLLRMEAGRPVSREKSGATTNIQAKEMMTWGAWVGQSAGLPTLDFGSSGDLGVLRSSLKLGSMLGVEPAYA